VIPTKRLGSEHITDFLVGEDTPHQPTWYAVELERPQALLFTQRGDPSAALTHAMRQIDDWRTWLSRNRDYASRAPEWAGLGLGDIDPELEGLVIIGRGSTLDTAVEDRRRRLARANRMRIETYDWLITQAENRAKLPLPDPWSGASPSEHGEDSFVEHPFVEHLVTCRVGHEYVVGSRSGGYPEEYGMWGWPEYCPECGFADCHPRIWPSFSAMKSQSQMRHWQSFDRSMHSSTFEWTANRKRSGDWFTVKSSSAARLMSEDES
jgi:hypothetical protein